MIYYSSRTGNVRSVVQKLQVAAYDIQYSDAPPISPFLLFTYTDQLGEIPREVASFMEQYAHLCKGIVCSGNINFGAQYYCGAGVKLSSRYNIPLGHCIDLRGQPQDIDIILKFHEKVTN